MGPTVTPADDELAARAARGDAEALGALYDRHASVLLGLAVRILRDRAKADDLVHDVFIEAWRAIGDFDPSRGSVRAWLFTRLRSRAIDGVRRRTRRAEITDAMATDPATAADARDPDTAFDAGRVRGWMQDLPSPQREALDLAYFEGLSMKAIAERQGVAVGTVKARVSRAVALLRAQRGEPT